MSNSPLRCTSNSATGGAASVTGGELIDTTRERIRGNTVARERSVEIDGRASAGDGIGQGALDAGQLRCGIGSHIEQALA